MVQDMYTEWTKMDSTEIGEKYAGTPIFYYDGIGCTNFTIGYGTIDYRPKSVERDAVYLDGYEKPVPKYDCSGELSLIDIDDSALVSGVVSRWMDIEIGKLEDLQEEFFDYEEEKRPIRKLFSPVSLLDKQWLDERITRNAIVAWVRSNEVRLVSGHAFIREGRECFSRVGPWNDEIVFYDRMTIDHCFIDIYDVSGRELITDWAVDSLYGIVERNAR